MKITTTQYAKSLYELTAGKTKHEVDGVVVNLIKVLQKNNQLKLVDKIIAKFNEISNQENGIVEAEVITRDKIQDTVIKKIEKFVKEKYSAKEVILHNKIDLNIKGGIVIKVGDEILDASIARSLSELKKELAR